jgi:hypothetical protein
MNEMSMSGKCGTQNIDPKYKPPIFEADDISILSYSLSLHPNLEFASFVAARARRLLKFPITTHDELAPLFSEHDLPQRIAKRNIRFVHVKRFFPCEFFPIESAFDFIGKIAASLTWGDMFHYYERKSADPETHFSQFAPKHCIAGSNQNA